MIPEHLSRRLPSHRFVPPAVATAAVLLALAAAPVHGADDAAEAAKPADTDVPTRSAAADAEAAREAKAARDEAAREKALLDGPSTRPPDWRLDKKMLPNDTTGRSAEKILARVLKPRSDSWADWSAPLEPLHHCGEPRALPPRCVPPPPCHPSQPPHPFDLVGAVGEPSGGPIYAGPCAPRTGTHDDCPHHRARRVYDRFFDWFYMWK
jgi:hypothetical protein